MVRIGTVSSTSQNETSHHEIHQAGDFLVLQMTLRQHHFIGWEQSNELYVNGKY